MKIIEIVKAVSIFILILISIIALSWFVIGNEFFIYKFFAPKFEDARRQVFEETKSYREGMIQELRNMQFQYIKASPEHKQALGSLILHRVADFKEENLPPDLVNFIDKLKMEKNLK